MAGQRLSLTFGARTNPAAYNVLYISTAMTESVKRQIFTSFQTWAEYTVNFQVPPHLPSDEKIEVWFPVPTVQPGEFGLALKALEGYTNSSDVVESARTMLSFGRAFSAELWRQLRLVGNQYDVGEAKLLEFAARFALDRPHATNELTTLRDALEQTTAWERYQLACLREEALLTGADRTDKHGNVMLQPFRRARLALRRQLLIDDEDSRTHNPRT